MMAPRTFFGVEEGAVGVIDGWVGIADETGEEGDDDDDEDDDGGEDEGWFTLVN